jgi:hypothetical protein
MSFLFYLCQLRHLHCIYTFLKFGFQFLSKYKLFNHKVCLHYKCCKVLNLTYASPLELCITDIIVILAAHFKGIKLFMAITVFFSSIVFIGKVLVKDRDSRVLKLLSESQPRILCLRGNFSRGLHRFLLVGMR